MSSNKKYYRSIDLIRVFACLAVLLYHLNLLKGGYLAVCVFFVLSGYLSCVSAFKKDKFSLLSYYSNKLIKIYLPLLIVVFISIFVISLFPDINWFNLKPETTSVLFGYNNFWQLGANLDYFARHVNSPFIHLWYIAILLQFDLIFPFIFLAFKKLGDKFSKLIPCVITVILAAAFSIYFYKMSLTENIMIVYYNTFTRLFSLLFGLALGFIHSYYRPLVQKVFKNKLVNKIIFYFYILLLMFLFILVDAQSLYFPVSMILTTLITCRLIDYSIVTDYENSLSIYDKFIKLLAGISYEIYLIQYPIIFLFQYIKINSFQKMFIMVFLLLLLSYILHFSLKLKKEKNKILRRIICIILLIISLFGTYQYLASKDYSLEMKQLQEQLNKNQQMALKKQEEYQLKIKEEEEAWAETLLKLENGEKQLGEVVTNLSIVGVGDSVMLGALQNLYNKFPNGYFDAQISRTAWVADDILQNLKNRNMLGDAVVLNLGANGDCSKECKAAILELCGDRHVFWVNVTNDNDVHVNDQLLSLAAEYNNLYIIDWNSISRGHSEYFLPDGIHLTEIGRNVYTQTIYDSIYNVYLKEYEDKKNDLLKQREEQVKNKISFYGNDILLNAYDYIQKDFVDAKFIINKEFDFEILKKELEKSKKEDSLTNKIVLAFDDLANLNSEDYATFTNLYSSYEIYILCTNKKLSDNLDSVLNENGSIINFYKEIEQHNEYLMPDGIHLTEQGNKALNRILNQKIK